MGDTLCFKPYHSVGSLTDGHQQIPVVGNPLRKIYSLNMHLGYEYLLVEKFVLDNMVCHPELSILELEE